MMTALSERLRGVSLAPLADVLDRLDVDEYSIDKIAGLYVFWAIVFDADRAVENVLECYATDRPWFRPDGELVREIPADCVEDCAHSGDCTADVEAWCARLGFTVPRDLAILWLAEFGAWDVAELTDASDDTLAERVLWLACCDIAEQGEWFGMVH